MIKIKENKSYLSALDLAAIDNGVAELGIHSLQITNFYTNEQKADNSRLFETLTTEQWYKRCKQVKHNIAQKVEKLINELNNSFMIYQYKNKDIDYRNDNWDLFFWCNSGDMSYVRLNPNTKSTNEEQKETIDAALHLLKGIEVDGIEVTIQYTTIYNEEKVKEVVVGYCEKVEDKFIEYGGYIGKIVKTEKGYLFRKKGAKKQQYYINNNVVLKNVFSV